MTSAIEYDFQEARRLEGLIAQIANGEQEALGALYEATRAAVYGFALSLLQNGGDAEDALQETYLRVWKAAPGYTPQGKPMAWVLTITRNLARSKQREAGRFQALDEAGWERYFGALPAVSAEEAMLLSAALNRLGAEERQIVMLHAVAGLKHRELSEMMGQPLGTLLSKYARAVKKLRLAMEDGEA